MNVVHNASWPPRVEKRWLGLILLSYAILAVSYSVTDPVFEGPDEIHHYAYVDYLQREHTLPVAELGSSENEFHQPPLYYLMTRVAIAPTWLLSRGVLDDPEPSNALRRNPFWAYRIGQVGVDNKSQFVHGPAEAFPYRGWVLRIHSARLWSILLQSLTIVATYLIGWEMFPTRPVMRLGSLAFVAFLPQFLFVAGTVSNDNLIVPLTALLTWLWVRGIHTGLSIRWAAAVGLLAGLAVLAKMSGLSLIPFSLLVAILIGWRHKTWRETISAWAVIIVVSTMLAGPILLRNQVLYGEPTALRRMSEIWGQHNPPLSYAQALRETPNVWTSFWARFGYGQIPVPNTIYLVLEIVALLAAAGLVVHLLRARLPLSDPLFLQVSLLIAIVGVFTFLVFSYIRVSLTGSNGRFIFPALPAFALLLFLGLSAWLPSRWHTALGWVVHVGMLAFAVLALILYLRPAYTPPKMLAERPSPQYLVNLRFGDRFELIGYSLDKLAVLPGEDAVITLYWKSLVTTDEDYTVFVHLLGSDGTMWGARDTYPGLGRLPTSQWQVERYLVDSISVPVSADAARVAPTALTLEVGMYDLDSMQRLPIVNATGRAVEFPTIGRLKLASRISPVTVTPFPDRRRFGQEIALVSYDVPSTAMPDQPLTITLYWQALTTPTNDYSVFIHLINSDDKIIAQQDGPPMRGDYPTSLWSAPEIVVDTHEVRLPATLMPGDYRVRLGLYNPTDGMRMPLLNDTGQILGDSIDLQAVRVGN